MPSFDTPESIAVTLEWAVGNVRIAASERTDTVVEVRPSDENDESDVQAAGQIRVDLANGELRVAGPRRTFDFSRRTRSVDVSIELPLDSRVAAHLGMGDVRASGRLGETRVRTTGSVRLERTGPLRVHTGFGDVTVDEVTGDADLSTASGRVRAGTVDGPAVVKNSNGVTTVDAVTGDLRVRNANGAVEIGRAGAGVDVKTATGHVTLGEVVRGSVTLGTAAGDLDVGIAEGTAAWLELNTGFGRVRNQLTSTAEPGGTDRTVEVRGRTGGGDITVHRSREGNPS